MTTSFLELGLPDKAYAFRHAFVAAFRILTLGFLARKNFQRHVEEENSFRCVLFLDDRKTGSVGTVFCFLRVSSDVEKLNFSRVCLQPSLNKSQAADMTGCKLSERRQTKFICV